MSIAWRQACASALVGPHRQRLCYAIWRLWASRLIHLYGLTETGPFLTSCEWQPAWNELDVATRYRMKARQGISQLLTDVRVMDEQMHEVPWDGKSVGEIVARGNNVMEGYYKQPEETARAMRGGWFHSGDLAVVHPDGYIEIVDRAKDVIVSGGENISSVEVEALLYEHPAVLEAAVVGVPDTRWGEVPKALVVLKPQPARQRAGPHQVLSGPHGPLQGPQDH